MSKAFHEVLAEELKAVQERRDRQTDANGHGRAVKQVAAPPEPAASPSPEEQLRDQREKAHNHSLVGMAFSGGGIRSGSVCIGFLQGLAKLRLLRIFDYLSTVSGGGYAGAWLAAWVHREQSLKNVEKQLDTSRIEQATADRFHTDRALCTPPGTHPDMPFVEQVDQEPEPVYHVRAYSNYLTPWAGLFSTDTWTLVAIYLRNTLVNLSILLAALIVVLVGSRFVVWAYGRGNGGEVVAGVMTILTAVCPLLALYVLFRNRSRMRAAELAARSDDGRVPGTGETPLPELSSGWFVWGVVVPVVLGAGLAVWSFGEVPSELDNRPLRYVWFTEINDRFESFGIPVLARYAMVFAVAAVVTVVLGVVLNRRSVGRTELREAGFTIRSALMLGIGFGTLFFLVLKLVVWKHVHNPALVATVAPPLLIASFVLAGFIDQALFCKTMSEYERELRSRVAAAMLMAAVAWFVFFAVTLYLPWAIATMRAKVGPELTGTVVVGWVGTAVAGVFASRSPKATPGTPKSSPLLAILARLGPVLCLLGILTLASLLLSNIIRDRSAQGNEAASVARVVAGAATPDLPVVGTALKVSNHPAGMDALRGELGGGVWVGLAADHWIVLAGVGIVCLSFSVLMSLVVDVNTFSLHALWGNRLVRCFLAASRRKPHENDTEQTARRGAPIGVKLGHASRRPAGTFTGFDAGDDIPLAHLRPPTKPASDPNLTEIEKKYTYDGPYPLFNTSLNLTAGTDLATRDRKAASFVLTPYSCGCELTKYATTPADTEAKKHNDDKFNLTLGRAMTISGAAADPNMPLQSPAQGALLTVLNVRMGWWIQNPATEKYVPNKPRKCVPWTAGPPTGGVLACFGRELFGLTEERNNYVHLSDGGHFDNSGVYELIRRRCRFVVALDAAEDLNDASENLANMMRRVRTDFGIRIEIDTASLKKDDKGLSKWHVAVGNIRYDDVDENGLVGMFVFVRSSLTGDEPADLREYAARDPRFPHHNTVTNQFFNEEQFESYRALGEHLAVSVFGEIAADFDVERLMPHTYAAMVRQFFSEVRKQWFPPPPDFNRSYLTAGATCTDLMTALRTDDNLTNLTHELYPEVAVIERQLRPRTAAVLGELPDQLLSSIPEDRNRERAEVLATNHILGVMETAWMGIELDGYYSHPMHRGWMAAFRRWASCGTFQNYWPVLRAEYSKEFIRFCEKTLNLPPISALARPVQQWDAGWTQALAPLATEFAQEWAELVTRAADFERKRETGWLVPPTLIAAIEPDETRHNAALNPNTLAWSIHLAPTRVRMTDDASRSNGGRSHLAHLPIGVLIVRPAVQRKPKTGAETEYDHAYEVIYWVRGAYRSLGLGRSAVDALLETPISPEAWMGLPNPQPGWNLRLPQYVRLELCRRHEGERIRLIVRYPIIGDTTADRLQRSLWMNFFHDYDFRRAPHSRGERFVTLKYDIKAEPTDRNFVYLLNEIKEDQLARATS